MTPMQVESTMSLTLAQQAAVARLVYALESPGGVAIVCGPRGVGKTLVLSQIAAARDHDDRPCLRCSARDGVPEATPHARSGAGILLVDDAHLVTAGELAAIVDTWRRRAPSGGLVLAGEGRLLTLVARDERIEQAVMLRAVLGPFTLAESRLAVASLVATTGTQDERDALVRTIHEIAAGIPAQVVRLAEFVRAVADSAPTDRLTPDDVESLHRRLSLQAA
ncbi:MAG: hypothetical protein WCR51_06635 [Planctomycetia bacterium]